MESIQKKFLNLVKVACYLMLGHYLAHQMGNQGSAWGLTKENDAGMSYFYFQQPVIPRDCQEFYHQCLSTQNASGAHLIKPDGLSEPFEAFCDNSVDSGAWTVILRRIDGSLDFNRNWTEYQTGFGFLNGEFWLGNEKLSYVVNQKKYELRIDIMNNEGTSCYLSYGDFRISDEWGDFKLVSSGQYSGTSDLCISLCPTNMEYGNCSCQATCEDPRNENGCNSVCSEGETCVCPDGFFMNGDDCVHEQDCGCFLEGEGVIKDGSIYINSECSRRCSCNNNQLTCEDLVCSVDAACRETDGLYQCQCNPGFEGDGQSCTVTATDCLELYNAGVTTNGVYKIYPTGWEESGFEVYCEMESNGGGWTVFQRRLDGSVDFYRDWASYRDGFGMLTHEFWLGNDKIHTLTQQKSYQLRIDVLNPLVGSVYHLYSSFTISDENDKYRLTIGTQIGTSAGAIGNPLNWNNGQPFSTNNQDNDDTSAYNCAEKHRGAWWYKYVTHYYYHYDLCWKWHVGNSQRFCSDSNLNGDYHETGIRGIFFWYDWNNQIGCGITRTEMKIRPL